MVSLAEGEPGSRTSTCRWSLPWDEFRNFRILVDGGVETVILIPPSRLSEGRIAIVTDVRRDAVDVEAPLTNGAEADGEVVWS
jgi:hypothetical protein